MFLNARHFKCAFLNTAILLLAIFAWNLVGAEELPLFKTGGGSVDEANAPFIEAGKRPPYAIGSRAGQCLATHEYNRGKTHRAN